MADDDAGEALTGLPSAEEHLVADVLGVGEGQSLDVDGGRGTETGHPGFEPGEVRSALDFEGVEAMGHQGLEEAILQDLLQKRPEAGD